LESQLTTVTHYLSQYQSNGPSTSNRHQTEVDVVNRILPKDSAIVYSTKNANKYNPSKKDVVQDRDHPLLQYPSSNTELPALNKHNDQSDSHMYKPHHTGARSNAERLDKVVYIVIILA
jgi:hypothetical protein